MRILKLIIGFWIHMVKFPHDYVSLSLYIHPTIVVFISPYADTIVT